MLLLGCCLLVSTVYSQCDLVHATATGSVDAAALAGQGFTAECDGDLESVGFVSTGTGVVSPGTLRIYDGNSTTGEIYRQNHSAINIANPGDPITVVITGSVPLTENSQYTFEFIPDNVGLAVDYSGGYAAGTSFAAGIEFTTIDFSFAVSISVPLTIDDVNASKAISLYPNPSSDFITISGLKQAKDYSIFDVLGNEIIKGSLQNDMRINIQNLNKGMYFLVLENEVTTKFICF